MVRNVVDKTPKDKRKSKGPQKRRTPSSEVIYSNSNRPGSAADKSSAKSKLSLTKRFLILLDARFIC